MDDMSALNQIVESFAELTEGGEVASFYRMVVMVMDVAVLLVLGGIEILSQKAVAAKLHPFVRFHLFSLPMLGLVFYGFQLFRTGPIGPGQQGAILHVIVLVWILLMGLCDWSLRSKKLGGNT